MSAIQRLGVEAFLTWAEAELSPDELDVLAYALLTKWDPEALRAGDVDVLAAIGPRLPKTQGRRP
jgi:hypothetical protein